MTPMFNTGELAGWLTAFSQNIVVGMLLVLVYNLTQDSVPRLRARVEPVLIGILFGGGAVASGYFPMFLSAGISADARTVFVLIGGLFGGPVGGAVAALIAIVDRIVISGFGAPPGIAAITISAVTGALFRRRLGERVRDLRSSQLFGIGLVYVVAAALVGDAVLALEGKPILPLKFMLMGIIVYPVATILLGGAMSMTHHRIWRQAQHRLDDLMETASDLIWETDEAQRFVQASGRYLDVTGYRPEDLIGKTGDSFGGHWVDAATEQLHAAAIAARRPFVELRYVVPSKSGADKILSISGRPVFDARRKFRGYRGTSTDITEREKSRELINAIGGRVADAVGESFLKNLVQTAAEVLGVDSVFIGRFDHSAHTTIPLYTFRDGKFQESHRAAAIEGMPGGIVALGKSVNIADGFSDQFPKYAEIVGFVPRAYAAMPLRDASGAVVGLLSFSSRNPWVSPDYLEAALGLLANRAAAEIGRMVAEEEIRRSRDLLQQAQRVGRIGSAVIDVRTDTAEWSEEMFRIFGLDRSRQPRSFDEVIVHVHPEDREKLRSDRARILDGNGPPGIDYRIVRPSGEIIWVREDQEIKRGTDGKPLTILSTCQNITEQKLAEIALKDSVAATQRVSRALAILAASNELVWAAKTEAELIDRACTIIVKEGGYALAWVGAVEGGLAKRVTLIALAAESAALEEYVRNANVTWDEGERGQGPTGRAVRSGQPVVARNAIGDPSFAPWRERALELKLMSSFTYPLREGTTPIYALMIYSYEVDAFEREEAQLLERLGANLTYGILSIRARLARRRAEREARATQAEMHSIMDHTVDGLITIDGKGTILSFSKPASHIFGYQPQEVLGKNVDMLMPSPFREQHDQYLAAYLATGEAKIIGIGREVRGLRKDGSVFPMDLAIGEIPDDAGGRRFVGTVRDVTARKLAEERLVQAQSMEALGKVASGVAHDFNNVLGGILGYAEFVLHDLDAGTEQRRFVERITGVAEQGRSLVRQILAFSRKSAVERSPARLADIVAEAYDLLRVTLPATTELNFVNEASEATVLADKGQMIQVVTNLAINASDALNRNAGKVDISIGQVDGRRAEIRRIADLDTTTTGTVMAWTEGGGRGWLAIGRMPAAPAVSIVVADNGSGIPEAKRSQIFDAFFTTKEKGKGTGLGLAIVHRIVADHGGAILVKTEAGRGSTFEVLLPAITSGRPAAARADDAKKRTAGATAIRDRILVVDDDEDLCDVIGTTLTRMGYDVRAVTDPREAARLIEGGEGNFRLLITDYSMPFMRGDVLVERFRARNPRAGSIICSAYAQDFSQNRSVGSGPDAFLQKPFTTDQLSKTLKEVFAK